MAEPPVSARRYCSVCGHLSSEPVANCPRCAMATAHVPQVSPNSYVYPPDWAPQARGAGPPAWVVITIILVIVAVVVLVTLMVDNVLVLSAATGASVQRASSLVERLPFLR